MNDQEQYDISYIDSAPTLTYGLNIVREVNSYNLNTFHLFADNGYAMYRGPISQAVTSKVITDRQQELYYKFKSVLDKWENIPTYIKVHSNRDLSNIKPLSQVYNLVFDLTFRHWINQMLPYCGKNALVLLQSKNIPSKINECTVISYDRQGHLVFYGEFVCDMEEGE